MSITPDDSQLADRILKAFSQLDALDTKEDLYKAVDNFLTGELSGKKTRFQFDNKYGLENIRFLNEQFRKDLSSLSKAISEIDSTKGDLKHKKYDEALTMMSGQVAKGDVIYQVQQNQSNILAAASPQAAQTYQQQRAQKAKPPKVVHTLSAATQQTIAKKIMSTLTKVLTPTRAPVKTERATNQPAARAAETAQPVKQQPETTAKTDRQNREQVVPKQTQTRHNATTSERHTESSGADRRQKIAQEDQRRRDKTKVAEERVDRAHGKDPTIEQQRSKEDSSGKRK